jgi:hypothetical protein
VTHEKLVHVTYGSRVALCCASSSADTSRPSDAAARLDACLGRGRVRFNSTADGMYPPLTPLPGNRGRGPWGGTTYAGYRSSCRASGSANSSSSTSSRLYLSRAVKPHGHDIVEDLPIGMSTSTNPSPTLPSFLLPNPILDLGTPYALMNRAQ